MELTVRIYVGEKIDSPSAKRSNFIYVGNSLVPDIFGDADQEFDFFYLRHLHTKIYNF